MDVFNELSALISSSNGEPIDLPNGIESTFESICKYTERDIKEFELAHDIVLPDQYKEFLLVVGACKCFIDSTLLGVTFYPLNEIYSYMNKEYDDYLEQFPNLFLVADDSRLGDAGFVMLGGDGKFSMVPHDEYIADWVEEECNWSEIKSWLAKSINFYCYEQ
ncbi:MAG: SMI1/KNR4 family protein [Maribacter sp.]|nr:SMI1/KNR4 family protein [Maribacter sp.]